jgi:hypothetical protein
MFGWEQKARSIKTGQLGRGFLGPGFPLGSRVSSIRKFPRPLCPLQTCIPTVPPRVSIVCGALVLYGIQYCFVLPITNCTLCSKLCPYGV